jgi:hypothetical protein
MIALLHLYRLRPDVLNTVLIMDAQLLSWLA